MTAPLTDARLDYLVDRAGFCRAGCEASEATGELAAEIRRLRAAHPTAWTDPDTGTAYDLTAPLLDADGDYWHHVGWVTLHGAPLPLVMWSPSADRFQLGARWSDVSVLPRVIEDCGPLTAPPADEAEAGGVP